jgi:uncharacterized membrane protein YtjA (UPF0391 family)
MRICREDRPATPKRSSLGAKAGTQIAELSGGGVMLKGAAIFLVIGLVAALLGFTTIAGASFAIAKVLAGIFLFIFLVLLALALFATRAA